MNGVFAHLPDHPHVHTILRYYEGCNRADAALIRATLARDVVHYWVDHRSVAGAEALSVFAARVAQRTRATWSADHMLVGADEAVVEWSMHWPPSTSRARTVGLFPVHHHQRSDAAPLECARGWATTACPGNGV